MTDYSIELADVSKCFKMYTTRRDTLRERFVRGAGEHHEFWALRDVNVQIEQGSTFGLIGHNGSGKSTLLKLLAGVHRTTSGTITTRGRISALLELGAGFHPELTGRENIRLNGSILGMSRKQIDAAMDDIVQFAGIEEFIDSPVKVYSSGMTVRLGFAVAVKAEPDILIVDEVIAVGDEEFQRKCLDRIFHLKRTGATIVVVSHSLGIVRDLCDSGMWLDHGRAVAVGPVGQVVEKYLDHVNERETKLSQAKAVADPESSGGGSSGLRKGRGSGEITITAIEYLDDHHHPIPFGRSGTPLTIRMHYSASQDEPNAEFAIGIVHESGVHIAALSSLQTGVLPIERGQGSVDVTVDPLPLQAGNFRLSAAIRAEGNTYDAHDTAFELVVRPASGRLSWGVVEIEGTWTHSGP